MNRLTQAELRVVLLVPTGKTNKEIATELKLSDKTVKFHMTRIFKKLDVKNRTTLTAEIIRGNVRLNDSK